MTSPRNTGVVIFDLELVSSSDHCSSERNLWDKAHLRQIVAHHPTGDFQVRVSKPSPTPCCARPTTGAGADTVEGTVRLHQALERFAEYLEKISRTSYYSGPLNLVSLDGRVNNRHLLWAIMRHGMCDRFRSLIGTLSICMADIMTRSGRTEEQCSLTELAAWKDTDYSEDDPMAGVKVLVQVLDDLKIDQVTGGQKWGERHKKRRTEWRKVGVQHECGQAALHRAAAAADVEEHGDCDCCCRGACFGEIRQLAEQEAEKARFKDWLRKHPEQVIY